MESRDYRQEHLDFIQLSLRFAIHPVLASVGVCVCVCWTFSCPFVQINGTVTTEIPVLIAPCPFPARFELLVFLRRK